MNVLAPGVHRLRPDDHFMILAETDASPMHVGALLILSVPEAEKAHFLAAARCQIAGRLPHTPLLARLVQAPDGYDSDVWADLAACDMEYHVQRVDADRDWTDAMLREDIARRSMDRLDLARPPFRAFVYDRLQGERCALYLKMHHAVADGIGFQSVLQLLSDLTAPAATRMENAVLPSPEAWRALSDAYFAQLAPRAAQGSARRHEALAKLEALKADPATRRARTPVLKLSGPISSQRAYATLSVTLANLKSVGTALGGTVNDIFLAVTSTALRRFLIEINDLPETPIVVNSARSYRRPEHGLFGNRIVAQHPHLATHLADPIERLRAIQQSMALERHRFPLDEAMLNADEKPNGASDRRAKFAARATDGKALLPGNITLSNVPGPAEKLAYAGYAQIANYPVPILGNGRFLNITSRRNGDMLDMGIMADPTKIADLASIIAYLTDAIEEYTALAAS